MFHGLMGREDTGLTSSYMVQLRGLICPKVSPSIFLYSPNYSSYLSSMKPLKKKIYKGARSEACTTAESMWYGNGKVQG